MAIATTETRHSRSLPRTIRRGLGRLGLRLRMVGAMRGLGRAAIILAVGAALAMAADVAFVLPLQARWIMWGTWIATAEDLQPRGRLSPVGTSRDLE